MLLLLLLWRGAWEFIINVKRPCIKIIVAVIVMYHFFVRRAQNMKVLSPIVDLRTFYLFARVGAHVVNE
jgi:hypothetical protein